MSSVLLSNIDKVHSTALGVERIKRNLALENVDVISWCKEKIESRSALIERIGKNWYVHADGCVITVNACSYTIITAHRETK